MRDILEYQGKRSQTTVLCFTDVHSEEFLLSEQRSGLCSCSREGASELLGFLPWSQCHCYLQGAPGSHWRMYTKQQTPGRANHATRRQGREHMRAMIQSSMLCNKASQTIDVEACPGFLDWQYSAHDIPLRWQQGNESLKTEMLHIRNPQIFRISSSGWFPSISCDNKNNNGEYIAFLSF